MAFTPIDIKDQSVQYPNRFKIDGVSKIIEPDFGTVTEAGTPINRGILQRYEDTFPTVTKKVGDVLYTTRVDLSDEEADGSEYALCNGDSYSASSYPEVSLSLDRTWVLGNGLFPFSFIAGIICGSLHILVGENGWVGMCAVGSASNLSNWRFIKLGNDTLRAVGVSQSGVSLTAVGDNGAVWCVPSGTVAFSGADMPDQISDWSYFKVGDESLKAVGVYSYDTQAVFSATKCYTTKTNPSNFAQNSYFNNIDIKKVVVNSSGYFCAIPSVAANIYYVSQTNLTSAWSSRAQAVYDVDYSTYNGKWVFMQNSTTALWYTADSNPSSSFTATNTTTIIGRVCCSSSRTFVFSSSGSYYSDTLTGTFSSVGGFSSGGTAIVYALQGSINYNMLRGTSFTEQFTTLYESAGVTITFSINFSQGVAESPTQRIMYGGQFIGVVDKSNPSNANLVILSTTKSIYSMHFADNYWVAVGSDGLLAYKSGSDITTGTWTITTIGSTSLSHIAYGGGYWMACGSNNSVAYYKSTPSGTWTTISSPPTINQMTCLTWETDRWVCYGSSGAFFGLFYKIGSPTNATWTFVAQSFTNIILYVKKVNNLWWAVQANSGFIWVSTNLITVPFTKVTAVSNPIDIFYVADKELYIVSGSTGSSNYYFQYAIIDLNNSLTKAFSTTITFSTSAPIIAVDSDSNIYAYSNGGKSLFSAQIKVPTIAGVVYAYIKLKDGV